MDDDRYSKVKSVLLIISLFLSIINSSYILYKEFYATADIRVIIKDAKVLGLAYYDALVTDLVPYWVELRALAINTGDHGGHIIKFSLENIEESEEISRYMDQVSFIEEGSPVDQIYVGAKSSKSFSILVKIWKRDSYYLGISQEEIRVNGSYLYFEGKDLSLGSVATVPIILKFGQIRGGSFLTRYGLVTWEGPASLLKEEQVGRSYPKVSDVTLIFPKLPMNQKVIIPKDYHYYWNISNLGNNPLLIESITFILYYPSGKGCLRTLSSREVMRIYDSDDVRNMLLEPHESRSLNLTRILRQIEGFKESGVVMKVRIIYSDIVGRYTEIWSVCYQLP